MLSEYGRGGGATQVAPPPRAVIGSAVVSYLSFTVRAGSTVALPERSTVVMTTR